jgi:hypothetical protein
MTEHRPEPLSLCRGTRKPSSTCEPIKRGGPDEGFAALQRIVRLSQLLVVVELRSFAGAAAGEGTLDPTALLFFEGYCGHGCQIIETNLR